MTAGPPICPLLHEADTDFGWAVVGPVLLYGRPVATHVVPNGDLHRHQLDPTCWCEPDEDSITDVPLWVHNAADDREAYASGEREPN